MSAGVAAAALATGLGLLFLDRRLEDVVMAFLFGIVMAALRYGYAASLAATACSVLSLDYFFTRPYMSFVVIDNRHYVTFVIMVLVAVLISAQTRRVKREAATRVGLALERARLAEEAQAANLEAREERLRSALLSSVSHDLRTPLAAIHMSATALLEGGKEAPGERVRQGLELIVGEAGRLARLVRNLMDMTSVQSGTLRARKEWHSLEEVLGVALGRLDESLGDRQVSVRVAPDVSLVELDAALIEQVFVNLVENAIKYTPRGSPIEISARRTAEGVGVEIADTGPGIPLGQEEAIFEKFRRATAAGAGMGLGLTICRGVLTAHGGRIWAGNRPEGGAVFRLLLPGEPAPAPAEPSAGLSQAAALSPPAKQGTGV